ncbi:hypothetical protein CSX00_03795 [Pseudobutyrivibrio ruminis]|uniref:Uncharacterized protein n=1 Tax=Pseudobutyrivibrio ruminis TaxID=46206 RepID=A0A2G3ECM0_9FIRM|nr:hypothetical protein [Pseudobutyrivibrio ruminis]PHU41078.1 hypothetical protein CSX00_03795 [Pseudobutyrivibrio ruminis]
MELAKKRAEEDFKDGKLLPHEDKELRKTEGCPYCTPHEPDSSSGIGDTTIVVPIKYCSMCGRKMPGSQFEKQVIST